jgi:hypothetical protein
MASTVEVLRRRGRDILAAGPETVEWVFTLYGKDATFVGIRCTGFSGTDDEIVAQALDSTGGFTRVLAGAKALLEFNLKLNLTADAHPQKPG